MNDLVANMRDFFSEGSTRTYKFRMEALRNLGCVLDKYEGKILDALYTDLGKSPFEGIMTETSFIKSELSYAIKHLKSWMKTEKVSSPLVAFPASSRIYREPYGLALIISPWNYPAQLTFAPLVSSIAAGNCSILKVSEISVATGQVISEIIKDAFDEKYIAVVQGGPEKTQKLLEEKFDYIFFTGSARVGRIVMTAAAKNLVPITLELGGKSPCIVDKTADISLAAKRIVWGKCLNAGQTCVAPDYLLAHNSIKDQLIKAMEEACEKFYGSDMAHNPEYPKIITKAHYERLLELTDKEKTLFGGSRDDASWKLGLTIMEASPQDKIMENEIFGPLLPVIGFDEIEEALALVNSKPKPLAFYLFSKNKEETKKIMAETSFGVGCVNDTVIQLASDSLPFGGVGESGMGQYHGKYGFETFGRMKSVMERSLFFDIPLRYFPSSKEKIKWIKKLVK